MMKVKNRTKHIVFLFILVFAVMMITGCDKKDKDTGNSTKKKAGDTGIDRSDSYDGNYGMGSGLADPDKIYDAGSLIQLDGSETFYVSVEDGYPWFDSKTGLSDGEKYIAVPVGYTDYGNSGKEVIAPEHVYLTQAKDENGNDLILDGKLKPVTDMPESEIKTNADTYYNSARPFKTDSGYEMELWALYKVPADTKECVIEFFPDDDFSRSHAGGFRINIKENTTYGTMEDKSAVEIAKMLDTDEIPSLEDFAWYTGAIRAAEDYCHFNNRHADYTGDNYMGGWKAYLVRDPDNEEGQFEAHLANIFIENFEPEDEYREVGWFDITLKWYRGFDADGNVTDESGRDDIVEDHAYFTYNRMNNEEGDGYPDVSFSIDFGADTAYGVGSVELSRELKYWLVVVRSDGKVLNQYGADTEHMPTSKTVKLPANMTPSSRAEGGTSKADEDVDVGKDKETRREESDDRSDDGSSDDGEEHYGPAAAARKKKEEEENTGMTPGKLKNERNGAKSYVVSDSDKEYLDKESIKSMDDKTLRLAINEIFARHGRKFNDKELQSFFDGKDWYKPKYTPDEFDKKQNSILNEVEKKNLQILTEERKRRE